MAHVVYDTPLVRKLGIRPGQLLCVVGAPEGFLAELDLPAGVRLVPAAEPGLDVALIFAHAMADVLTGFAPLAAALAPDGGLWVAYPKKAAKVPTDITFELVQAQGLAAGLVDNKVCRIDEVYTALRFVVRVRDRAARAAPGA